MTFVTFAALQDVVAMDAGGLVISAALSGPQVRSCSSRGLISRTQADNRAHPSFVL